MKKMTMQEFADTFNMYVAKDSDNSIYAYGTKPAINIYEGLWNNEAETQEVRMLIIEDDSVNWVNSLCTPHSIKKSYRTPCGNFEEGELVGTGDGAGVSERIFYAYDEKLVLPYVCVADWCKGEYKNNKKFNTCSYDEIKKIPQEKYNPYDEPGMDWIGKEVKLKSISDESNRTISGFEKLDGVWNVLFADNYRRDLEECFKTLVWDDGSVFGEEN